MEWDYKEVVNKNFKPNDLFENEKYCEYFFQQYKLSSEMARQSIDRRIEVNKFYVTAFGAAAAGVGICIGVTKDSSILPTVALLSSLFVTLLSFSWHSKISFLLKQSHVRQEILEVFEEYLPASHWGAINSRLHTRGLDDKIIERAIPLVFLVGAIAASCYTTIYLFNMSK